jgi:exopolysaccharide biosynthesis protein
MITTSSGQNLNDFGFRMGGSTTHQMFDWMKQLGASDGVALDGGGTTSMFARIAGSIERIDIPNEAWIRPAPLGLIVKPND